MRFPSYIELGSFNSLIIMLFASIVRMILECVRELVQWQCFVNKLCLALEILTKHAIVDTIFCENTLRSFKKVEISIGFSSRTFHMCIAYPR